MDPATLSTLVVGFLSPLVTKGLEEVAKSAFKDVYAAIKEKLSRSPEGKKAVESYEKNPEQSKAEFHEVLKGQLISDQVFYDLLLKAMEKLSGEKNGISIGNISANKVVVSRDINNLDMGN